ncbi:hypothetical protein [Herbaspirillum autotrophicum]|uniref:hypothetical protein n=1 Tax=Herbaspirillum autotrophicum TaxID=180195 RepID=UPI0012ED3F01|nr:hypothetical protein [Herbaspirillum autotrophicum]
MASGATQQYAQIDRSLRVLAGSAAGRVALLTHNTAMRRVARLASDASGKYASRGIYEMSSSNQDHRIKHPDPKPERIKRSIIHRFPFGFFDRQKDK